MSVNSKNTALLVFIRDSKSEVAEKVFTEHLRPKQNQKLVSLLNRRIIKLCKSTNYKTFVFSTSDQYGTTFGERFANAFESVFEKGFEQVIAVGNDCLAITNQTFENANQSFANNEIVVGPALDGGLYMVGLSKKAYHRKRFLNFQWKTGKLSHDFVNYANETGLSIKVLEAATDIDNANDLLLAIKKLPRLDRYRKKLELFLSRVGEESFNFILSITQLYFYRHFSLRAPPV